MVLWACLIERRIEIHRPQLFFLVEQRSKVLGQRSRDAWRRRISGLPLRIDHRSNVVLVEMAGVTEHQVGLEVVVQALRLRRIIRQPLSKERFDARQQRVVQLAQVGIAAGVADRAALIQAPSHRPRRARRCSGWRNPRRRGPRPGAAAPRRDRRRRRQRRRSGTRRRRHRPRRGSPGCGCSSPTRG